MEDPDEKFNEAVKYVRYLTVKPTNDELLKLYGLFKQATEGNNKTPKPGFLDLKGKYKWESWKSYSGVGRNRAKDQYVQFADSLMLKYPNSLQS